MDFKKNELKSLHFKINYYVHVREVEMLGMI